VTTDSPTDPPVSIVGRHRFDEETDMAATAPQSVTDAISYEDLYARWERGNWRATEIDFGQDAIDWREKLTAEQRRSALWLYALFFHGEDSVADNLSPYIDAAPLEEQKYFLTTQQVDEARHSVFFRRFMHEVAGLGDGTTAGTLRATDDQITWGHRMVFSRLDRMADELRADRSKPKLAAAITLYHVVVEASLAQPGQHMIEAYLEEFDVLPGFREGMRNVALDEQRHIGFGVKLLADLYREDPEPIGEAILGLIREVLPWTAAVAKPPNWDRSYTECFGFTLEDLGEAGALSIEQKLRAIGLPIDDLPRFPMPMDLPPRERAVRGQKMLRAGLLGPGDEPVVADPEAIAILFDTLRRQADPGAVRPGTTIQWVFADAEPWYLSLAGDARATQGLAAHADLTLRCRFADWADVTSGRADPRRLMLRRRLRPKGDWRVLLALGKVLG
jgi:ribonucleotide reductase beta subunit family protein with ferritin-like domain